MLQFGSKHVCIEDVQIFKHCHEMTLFFLWIGTYCISCVVQQKIGVKNLSSLVRYDDSSLAAIRHVQSITPVVRPRPNIRSHRPTVRGILHLSKSVFSRNIAFRKVATSFRLNNVTYLLIGEQGFLGQVVTLRVFSCWKHCAASFYTL